jgi:hypothetical protein
MLLFDEDSRKHISYTKGKGKGMIQWMDKQYTSAPEYYREVVLTMPRTKGIILGAQEHIDAMAQLTATGIYVIDTDDSDIYVDGWRVNGDYITHKHPEFGVITTQWTKGAVECDVLAGGQCDMCGDKIPGEIDMMHQFYKLNG